MPKAIEGMDDGKAKETYENITDLENVFTVKSFDELKELLNEHFYCINTDDAASSTTTTIVENKAPEPAAPEKETVTADATDDDDDDIANLLNSLDDIK